MLRCLQAVKLKLPAGFNVKPQGGGLLKCRTFLQPTIKLSLTVVSVLTTSTKYQEITERRALIIASYCVTPVSYVLKAHSTLVTIHFHWFHLTCRLEQDKFLMVTVSTWRQKLNNTECIHVKEMHIPIKIVLDFTCHIDCLFCHVRAG